MNLRHIGLLLTACSLALAASAANVRLGPEIALTAQSEMAPAYFIPYTLASNGHGALALLAHYYGRHPGLTTTLKLVPITADGRSMNPRGRSIAVYSTDHPSYEGLLATDGNDYLVVWINGTTVYSQFVDPAGEPLRPAQIVTSQWSQPDLGALVWNGFCYALIGESEGLPQVILLDRDGDVLRSLGSIFRDRVLWTGIQNGQFVVVTPSQIHQFNEFGSRTSVPFSPPPLSTSEGYLIATASPDRILFVQPNSHRYAVADFHGNGLASGVLSGTIYSYSYSPWWDGIQFVVAWQEHSYEPPLASRISPSGVNLDPKPLVLTGAGAYPLMAQTDSGQLLLSLTDSTIVHVLQGPGAIASPLGKPNVVAQSGREEGEVQIADSGGHRLVLSCDRRSYDINATLDGNALRLRRGDDTCVQSPPALAAGDRDFLVAAYDWQGLLFTWRIPFNGQIRASDPKIVEPDGGPRDGPYAAHHRDRYVVSVSTSDIGGVYRRQNFSFTEDGYSLLSSASSVEKAPYLFRPLPADQEILFPFAFLDSHNWLGGCCIWDWNFEWTRGGVTTPLFRRPGYDPVYGYYQSAKGFAAAATSGNRVTFVWNESETSLLAAQTSLDGKPIGLPRVIAGGGVMEVEIAWNGSEYVVAWSSTTANEPQPRIRAIRLDASAKPLDDAPFVVSPLGAIRDRPSISVTESGVDIAYSRIEDANGGAPRAFVRSLDRLPPVIVRRRSAGH